MGHSRYNIYESTAPHFLTRAVGRISDSAIRRKPEWQ